MTDVRTTEPTAPVRPRAGAWGWVRLAIGCLWLALFVMVPVVGEREASLADLERAIADGEVGSVEVGGGFPDGTRGIVTGYGTAIIHWRDGVFARATEVQEVAGRRAEREAARGDGTSDGLPVVGEDAAQYVRGLDPDLDVRRGGDGPDGVFTEIWGFRGPGWLALGGLAATLATLVVLVVGLQPWRATRWAWFWFSVFLVPFGQLAFLLLSGPTRGLPPPRRPDDRLTGGWAFLIALAVGAFAGGVGGALGL